MALEELIQDVNPITFTATLFKPTFSPVELAWGVFIFVGFFCLLVSFLA